MFYDEADKVYFIFLKPILYRINNLKLSFQKENLDIGSMHQLLYEQFLSFAKWIMKPAWNRKQRALCTNIEALDNPLALLNSDCTDYSVEFEAFLEKSVLSDDSKLNIKVRCRDFLLRLLKELCLRVPENMNLYAQIKTTSSTESTLSNATSIQKLANT